MLIIGLLAEGWELVVTCANGKCLVFSAVNVSNSEFTEQIIESVRFDD